MTTLIATIREALLLTLKNKILLALFFVLWAVFFTVMFLLPVYAIPGNDVRFQMLFFKIQDYALIGLFSMLSSLIVVMHINIFHAFHGAKGNIRGAAVGSVGVFSGFISSIFASAACFTCIGALFSFSGFGIAFFLGRTRWYVLSIALLLLMISLTFASRRLVQGCRTCAIEQ